MEHTSQFADSEVFSQPASPLKSAHRPTDSYDALQETQSLIQKQINMWAELKYFLKIT